MPRSQSSATPKKNSLTIQSDVSFSDKQASAENSHEKRYYFLAKDLETLGQKLQVEPEEGKSKLKALFTKIYDNDENNIPQDIKSFLDADYGAFVVSADLAKKIFICIDNTAGYGLDKDDETHKGQQHSGFDLALVSEGLRNSFIACRQSVLKVEKYKTSEEEEIISFFSGVPHADMSKWKSKQGDFELSGSQLKGGNGSYKLLISSYISALDSAKDFLKAKECKNYEQLEKKLNEGLKSESLTLTNDEYRAIQEANCVLKLGMAQKAGIIPVLSAPNAFAGPLELNSKEEFKKFIKEILTEKMEPAQIPEAVILNFKESILIKKDGEEEVVEVGNGSSQFFKVSDITGKKTFSAFKSAFKKSFSSSLSSTETETETIVFDCCAANFPMSLYSYSVSQGKDPNLGDGAAEESMRGLVRNHCQEGDTVDIYVDGNRFGSSIMKPLTKFFTKRSIDKETTSAASSHATIPTADDKPKPGLYWVLKHTKTDEEQLCAETDTALDETGAFDFYILKQDETVFKILQPNGIEEVLEREGLMESFKKQYSATTTENNTDKTTTINSKRLSTAEEEVTNEEKDTIKLVHSCFGGHSLGTCGFTTLLTALALLGKATKEDEFVTIKIPGFEGDIKLSQSKDVDSKDVDYENRKIFAEWLKKNEGKFKSSSETLFVDKGTTPFQQIIDIAKKERIEGYQDYLSQEQAFGIYDAALTQKVKTEAKKQEEKGGEELKKELEGQQDKLQEYGIKINWDNITIDDLAILALLSAFLVVMASEALALPVALAAFRTLSLEIGWKLDDDGELKKLDKELPSTTPSEPVAYQLKQEKTYSTAVA